MAARQCYTLVPPSLWSGLHPCLRGHKGIPVQLTAHGTEKKESPCSSASTLPLPNTVISPGSREDHANIMQVIHMYHMMYEIHIEYLYLSVYVHIGLFMYTHLKSPEVRKNYLLHNTAQVLKIATTTTKM